jgi:hypothetical protein
MNRPLVDSGIAMSSPVTSGSAEHDRPVLVLERRRHESPHVLVTLVPMGENDRLTIRPATGRDIVSGQDVDIHAD